MMFYVMTNVSRLSACTRPAYTRQVIMLVNTFNSQALSFRWVLYGAAYLRLPFMRSPTPLWVRFYGVSSVSYVCLRVRNFVKHFWVI